MKVRMILAIVGLATSFALPIFAQQTNSPDPQLRQVIDALTKKTDEAYNNGDAVAMAALYTEDAVLVTDAGPIYGRDAIERHYANLFQKIHFISHVSQADQNSPHIISTAGDEVWSSGTTMPSPWRRTSRRTQFW
jgi:uncharacterized protein (TIGR02246 family)